MREFKIYTEEEKVELDLMAKEVIEEIMEEGSKLSHKDYFNILIAEFMGGVYYKWREIAYPTAYCWRDIEGHKDARRHYDLEYDSSWEWLMPVILKIGEIELTNKDCAWVDTYYPETFGSHCDEGYLFGFYSCKLHKGATVIEAAYNAVIDFIKDYNKNKC